MTTRNDAVVAHLRLGRGVLMTLCSVGFVVAIAWILATGPGDPESYFNRRHAWLYPWFYWIGLVFFGVGGIVLGRAAIDRRPQVYIGPDGIWSRRWSNAVVPWSEVEAVETKAVSTSGFLQIKLRDAARYPAASLFARGKRSPGSTKMPVPVSGLDRSADEIIAAIARYRSS